MRKYDSKVLRALVIAYKNGIINKGPLGRWLNNKKVINNVVRYVAGITVFAYLFTLFATNKIMSKTIFINGFMVNRSRILAGLTILLISVLLYKLVKYSWQVYYVNKMMKKYRFNDGDIKILDQVTFKIQA
jgi:hypothetical protein